MVRLTWGTRRVLVEFLRDPSGWHYGLDIGRAAGMSGGSLYPALARLEEAGWATSRWEDVDPSAEKRPRRHLYRLTPEGRVQAEKAREQLIASVAWLAWRPGADS